MPRLGGRAIEQARQTAHRVKQNPYGTKTWNSKITYTITYNVEGENCPNFEKMFKADSLRCLICTGTVDFPSSNPTWCKDCFRISFYELKDKSYPRCTSCKGLATIPKTTPYWCQSCFKIFSEKAILKGSYSASKNS